MPIIKFFLEFNNEYFETNNCILFIRTKDTIACEISQKKS